MMLFIKRKIYEDPQSINIPRY